MKGYLQHFGSKIAKIVRCYCHDVGQSERNIFDFSLCVGGPLLMHYYLHALLLACTAKNCGSGIRGSENRVTGGAPVVKMHEQNIFGFFQKMCGDEYMVLLYCGILSNADYSENFK